MNILDGYLVNNYVLLLMLIGMLTMSVYDVFLRKDMIRDLRVTILLIFLLSLSDNIETYYGNLPYLSVWRLVFSALSYSIRPVIILGTIFIVYDKASKLLSIPAIINVLVSFSCFFSKSVYYFTDDNHFQRGPFGYTQYIVCAFYVVILLIISIRIVSDHSIQESLILFVMALSAVGAAMFGLFGYESGNLVNHTFGACIMMYYLYTYSQYTKRDALTGLLNRHSYYSHIEKHGDSVSGVISIDMNELKWLNDNFGHEAGDKGIATVGRCFKKNSSRHDKVYRIGGDEFMVLCSRGGDKSIKEKVDAMRKAVDESGYSCAFGYCDKGSLDDMIKKADEFMYEDKARIKAEMKETGKTVHFRD